MAKNYDLSAESADRTIEAPAFDYGPRRPAGYRPRIGLIGCGGITAQHLEAYRQDGYPVVALCDLDRARAEEKQREFAPGAALYTDYREVLADDSIDIVDVALHPQPRAAVIADALEAGKHVLSQKPFALDLDVARDLVARARDRQRCLAVNQNGRWSPYMNYIRQLIAHGVLGDIHSVAVNINWDHTWVRGTPFERIPNLVLYDFGIHWMDMAVHFFGSRKALAASATTAAAPGQSIAPPLLAAVLLEFEQGTATLNFDGHSKQGAEEVIRVTGSKGVVTASGPPIKCDRISLTTAEGTASTVLSGSWFPDGFRGAMGELACAIEEGRAPAHSGENNLRTLEVVFAAIHAADHGIRCRPGEILDPGPGCLIKE